MKRIKSWIRNNKAYVIWVSIIMGYTFIMLGIIVVIRVTDGEDRNSFSSRVNQVRETENYTDEETSETETSEAETGTEYVSETADGEITEEISHNEE